MIMSVMFSAGEVNLLVCDLENAARYARSDLFYDLTEVLSQEELAEYSDRLITFEMVDEEGNPLGEQTPPYGMDLSNSDSVKRILGGDPCGIFIPLCAGDMDLAMELFWKIVNS